MLSQLGPVLTHELSNEKINVQENWLDSCSAGEELGITEDHKLNPSQEHHPVMKKANTVLGSINRFLAWMTCDGVPSLCLAL